MSATTLLAPLAAEARGQMYGFLSAAFLGPPGAALLKLLGDGDVLDQLGDQLGSSAVAELRPLADRGATEDMLVAIRQEYMDLFAVPTGRYLTPFEDVYRGSVDGLATRGPLLGEGAVAVRRLYRQVGVEMDPSCPELPTHVGVELAFMRVLCEEEAAALRTEGKGARDPQASAAVACRQLQLSFLREHLTAWVPQLCQAIGAQATSPFYRALARITEAFLAWDAAGLSLEPEDDEAARARSC